MRRVLPWLFLFALFPAPVVAGEEAPATPPPQLSRFGQGEGPSMKDGTIRLLDALRAPRQSNAAAFDVAQRGAFESLTLEAKLRVLPGGDGGSFLFLSTREYGMRGPAPFVPSWVEPNLRGSFAVGVDVHDPPSQETFTAWGNYEDRPQREISLHWDGREIVKRVAPEEFRGRFVDLSIEVRFGVGGADVTVRIAGAPVYERYFVAGMTPYEARLAIGAGTREDAKTSFDVKELRFTTQMPAAPRRPPLHVEVFDHVRTDALKQAFGREITLPPTSWAFGRVLLTLDLHDAGEGWDEWDRNGEVAVRSEGTMLGIVPFITSYRTPCHWVVDVTHFRPLLAGRKHLEVAAGTTFYRNRGFLLSVSLDYFPGTLELEPYRVVPLWMGTAKYRSAENHFRDFFAPVAVQIDRETTAARVFVTTTGHSQVGEFTPSRRTVVFAPVRGDATVAERRFEDVLWKTDCYLNPNRPQAGTWQYSRAGWAPGDVVRPWWIDLTPFVTRGAEAELRYEPQPYDFAGAEEKPTDAEVNEAIHVVRSYLILYRAPGALVDPPTLRIADVVEGSNAAKAGMKAGDYLATYAGKAVSSREDVRFAMETARDAGAEHVTVVLYREGERLELVLPPGPMGVHLAER